MAFGLLNGIYFIPLILNGTVNKKKNIDPNKLLPSFNELKNMIITFLLISFSHIIFRADNISQAFAIYRRIFSLSLISYPANIQLKFVLFVFIFMLIEWVQRGKQFSLQIGSLNPFLRKGIYYVLLSAIIFYSSSQITQFIYLKF